MSANRSMLSLNPCRVSLPLLFLLLFGLAGATVSGQDLEQVAKELEGELIAPCCWRQPVSVHESEAATEVRKEIREFLNQGLNREQVLARFVDRYGVQILAAPPATGIYQTAYWIPLAAVALGVALLVLYWRHHRSMRVSQDRPRSIADPSDLERVRRAVLDEL